MFISMYGNYLLFLSRKFLSKIDFLNRGIKGLSHDMQLFAILVDEFTHPFPGVPHARRVGVGFYAQVLYRLRILMPCLQPKIKKKKIMQVVWKSSNFCYLGKAVIAVISTNK